MYLVATTDKIQVLTDAALTLACHASFLDVTGTAVAQGRQNTAITTATTIDVVAAPASGSQRAIQTFNIRASNTSAAGNVTILYNQNGTTFELFSARLTSGQSIIYTEDDGFRVEDRQTAISLPATATAQLSGTATDTYITGSAITIPTSRPVKIGTVFAWDLMMTKAGVGTGAPTWNLRAGTLATTGDTARSSLTPVATQTAVADNARVRVTAAFRSIGATATIYWQVFLTHNLAATGFANIANYVVSGLTTSFDVGANNVIGLSVNPGTAAAWTFETVIPSFENW